MEKSNLVAIRDFLPNDRNFILSCWLKGLYYGDSWFSTIPKDLFMKQYHDILVRLLAAPGVSVRVACLKEDADVILGYSVSRGPILDWVFVKAAWRQIGIGKSLTPPDWATVSHLTKLGKALKPSHIVFNPFL